MKILHITPSYKPAWIYGGPTRSVASLCENIADLGYTVNVITTTANGKMELPVKIGVPLNIEGVTVTYYPRWTKDHSHFSPRLLLKLCFFSKKDLVVHIHSWWNLVALFATIICIFRGVKPIVSIRGMLSPYTLKSNHKKMFHRAVGQHILRKTIFHATSRNEAMDVLSLMPGWKHFLLPNIIELPIISDKYQKNILLQDICVLIVVSRIHPVKGLETLFDALRLIDSKWRLQIVGNGDSSYINQLQNLASQNSISENIEWLGWLEGEEKVKLISSADLFILPSLSENFANVIVESLSLGTSVILSKSVGMSDYVESNDLGWLFDGTAEDLAQKIQIAWKDKYKRESNRIIAPQKIREDFNPQSIASQYIDMYKKITNK